MVSTVYDRKQGYSSRDVVRADFAKKVQEIIGRPSTNDFLSIISNNLLPNCKVTVQDIKMAEDIYGPNLGSLKGKMTRDTPSHVQIQQPDPIPITIMDRYHEVTLCIDIMYINNIPFLISISRHIKFGTAEKLPNRQFQNIMKAIRGIYNIYAMRGFIITIILGDNEFEPYRGMLASDRIYLNITSADEHVPEVERYIRTIKERCRAIYNTLPFKKFPALVVVHMVYFSVFWLNSFPAKQGISSKTSPRTIITGYTIDFNAHCRLEFGAYVQTHESHSNDMNPRTIGAICLGPRGNIQGGYNFMSLVTGERIHRRRWTSLPMPEEVIVRIGEMASSNNQGLTLHIDEEHDLNNGQEENSIHDSISQPEIIEEQYDNDFYPVDEEEVLMPDPDEVAEEALPVEAEEEPINHPVPNDEADNADILPLRRSSRVPRRPQRLIETHMLTTHGMNSTHLLMYNSSNHELARHLKPQSEPTGMNKVIMTQYGMRQGIKQFGKKGVDALMVELKQLDVRKVLEPVHVPSLSKEEKRMTLNYIMFLKEKHSGVIKGRGCADGRKQRAIISKEHASSPTISTEALFLTCVIDALEHRHVATTDIPGAFMHADIDELVHVRFQGTLAELLSRINPKLYRKYVYEEKGKPVLYAKLAKTLYGTLRAALLFWRNLTQALNEWGFEINRYEPCVANKNINGKQCTITWHVDDLKISHVDEQVVLSVIRQLNNKYGKVSPLSYNIGKKHNYLGMLIDYSENGHVKIDMRDYITRILDEVPPEMRGKATTPAATYLFDTNESCAKLSEEEARFFHYLVAKLLFLSKRGRPDIQTAVAFLSTRVKNPDGDDLKKLSRVIKYLDGSVDIVLRLSAQAPLVIKWWIDGSFAIHRDMRSHTGGTMTMGYGSIISNSTKQKLNTRSSTEAELVAVDDMMPQVLWTKQFLEEQGFQVHPVKILQDNRSAMLLEENGKASSSKRTRHIQIRYYFVTDQVAKKNVMIQHCPTKLMVADFFTKPLQGSPFHEFRKTIMGLHD